MFLIILIYFGYSTQALHTKSQRHENEKAKQRKGNEL